MLAWLTSMLDPIVCGFFNIGFELLQTSRDGCYNQVQIRDFIRYLFEMFLHAFFRMLDSVFKLGDPSGE